MGTDFHVTWKMSVFSGNRAALEERLSKDPNNRTPWPAVPPAAQPRPGLRVSQSLLAPQMVVSPSLSPGYSLWGDASICQDTQVALRRVTGQGPETLT